MHQVIKGRRVAAEFDGQWVTIRRRIGGETRIPVGSVLSVETDLSRLAAMTSRRYIRFVTAASSQRATISHQVAGKGKGRIEDPNTVTLSVFRNKTQRAQAIEMRDAVLQALAVRHSA